MCVCWHSIWRLIIDKSPGVSKGAGGSSSEPQAVWFWLQHHQDWISLSLESSVSFNSSLELCEPSFNRSTDGSLRRRVRPAKAMNTKRIINTQRPGLARASRQALSSPFILFHHLNTLSWFQVSTDSVMVTFNYRKRTEEEEVIYICSVKFRIFFSSSVLRALMCINTDSDRWCD